MKSKKISPPVIHSGAMAQMSVSGLTGGAPESLLEGTSLNTQISIPKSSTSGGLLAFKTFIKQFLCVSFVLYVVALTCSMAGMEIFSWLTALLTLLYIGLDYISPTREINFKLTGYGPFIFVFVALCSLGIFINAPKDHWVRDLGALRDFFLFFFFFYSLKIFKNVKVLMITVLVCASIIAVYGIWQHYTGIDLWRHSHRALVVIPWGKGDVYSTVGLFNHHLTYAYSYGMILCIAWAMLLLMNIPKFPKMIVSIGFALILGSIICTYGRGAWIALGITLPFMTLLTSRKNFVIMLTLFCVGLGVLYKVNGTFRERLQSIDSANYKSNEERRKLWEINFEMFKDHPLVGVGYLENEDLSFPYYERMHISDGMAGHAHSNYFEFLATAGLPGFIAYLVMIILPLILSVKLFLNMRGISGTEALWDRCMILAAVGAQLVFHIGGFTQCTVCDSKVLHQFIFWLALVYFFRDKYKDRDLSLRSHPLAQTQPNLS